jgi:hypothetical protein
MNRPHDMQLRPRLFKHRVIALSMLLSVLGLGSLSAKRLNSASNG